MELPYNIQEKVELAYELRQRKNQESYIIYTSGRCPSSII